MLKNYIIENCAEHDFTSPLYYVYELIDPNNNQPFYVGKGVGNRATSHITYHKNKKQAASNVNKTNKIVDIIRGNKQIVIKIVASFEAEDSAFNLERDLIQQYGRICNGSGILTNILNGGEGYTQDGRQVDQYTMWGEFVATWKNAPAAARLNGWTHHAGICGCCIGKERSYKGFLWCYSGQLPTLLTHAVPVYQWTLTGEFVKVHRNSSVAAREVGLDTPCGITRAISNKKSKNNYSHGFLWSASNSCPDIAVLFRRKSVKNITTGEVFGSITEAAESNPARPSTTAISRVCKGKQAHAGKMVYCYVAD
jgi:hypothetical protein